MQDPSLKTRDRSRSGNVPGTTQFTETDSYRQYRDNPHLKERNATILRMIPSGVRRILDVGSGPGIASRALADAGLTVWSLDASRSALEARPPNPICASAADLPCRAGAVDLVLSLELLEHLPPTLVPQVAEELVRVSRRWILLGVPHRENIRRNLLQCPRCRTEFNRSGHLNRFDAARIAALFPGCSVRATQIEGPPVRDYPAPLLWMRHRWARRYAEMAGRGGIRCPECGNGEFPEFHHNLLSFGLDGLNKIVSRRRPYWILQLFEKA